MAVQERGGTGVPTIHYFHGAGDPHSALAVQLLPGLAQRHGVAIVPHLVPPPADAAAPDRARLDAWALADAARLAEAHGLAFPRNARLPSAAEIAAAESVLAGIAEPALFAERAAALAPAFWTGGAVAPGDGDRETALAEGAAALSAAGHYLPGVFAFEGECYWGVDRIPHLEARLARAGSGCAPLVRQLEAGGSGGDARGAELHFYLSFRSPYTYLAAARARALAARWNARLVLRPVLPMVMRGLPVPRAKRLYIVRDAAREAERLGIVFGRIADPVGPGVERGLAVLARATAMGRGADFAESFLAGAFADGIDAASDDGLARMAERAELSRADIAAALADEGWRATAEANRAGLLDLGLWGVPAFRVGSAVQWGQDRLWAVEQDLARLAAQRGCS